MTPTGRQGAHQDEKDSSSAQRCQHRDQLLQPSRTVDNSCTKDTCKAVEVSLSGFTFDPISPFTPFGLTVPDFRTYLLRESMEAVNTRRTTRTQFASPSGIATKKPIEILKGIRLENRGHLTKLGAP